ncbi:MULTISPECIES: translation initiation factor aIF-1A [Acidianus]|uniref:Translation initiation factor 1A n=1 Tax=Candidatus Acidianus copahuensis TaxID=1160895 RepID=A0A031LSK0_9CREN|nr:MULTISPECIES: translation initiation factor aIF-1A [Acidianus]EZQ10801.1 translation initiation factor IF-1A [Candidatus Acidianus copahuensis]NON63250.1 translation initiation factor IF-1A [Acidianus sp. RZ1]
MPKKEQPTPVREVVKPSEGEVICVVKKMLGAEHIVVLCVDGKQRTARIPGRMRKKVWIREGDVVLVAPWDFQSDKGDITYRYMNDELKRLIEEKVVTRDIIDQLRG